VPELKPGARGGNPEPLSCTDGLRGQNSPEGKGNTMAIATRAATVTGFVPPLPVNAAARPHRGRWLEMGLTYLTTGPA